MSDSTVKFCRHNLPEGMCVACYPLTSFRELERRCRSCGKAPGRHDDDCINHAGQFGYE